MFPASARRKKLLLVDLMLAVVSFCLPFIVHWRLLTPNLTDRLFIDQDVTISIYPALVHLSYVVQQGGLPLWNWHVYGGMYEGGAFYNHLLYPLFFPFLIGWFDLAQAAVFNGYLLLHLGIGALGMYFLARSLKFHPYLSLIGSCIYGLTYLSSYSLITGGAFLLPFAWLPFVLIAWRGFALGKGPHWALWGGLAWFFCLLSANPIAIVPIIPLVMFWLVLWGREGHRRELFTWTYFLSWIALTLVLTAGLWIGQILPMWESLSVSSRNATASYEWARMSWRGQKGLWVLLRDFLLPHYGGSPLSVASLGAVGSILLGIGIWVARGDWERPLAWFTLVMAAVLFLPDALMIYDFAYLLVPLVDRSNAIDRGALAYVLPAILIALAGVRWVLRHRAKAFPAYGYLAAAVVAVYALVYGLGATRFNYNGMLPEKFLALTLHMGLFAAVALLALRLMVRRPAGNSSGRYLFALAIIACLDVSALARDQFQAYFPAESMKNTGRGSYLPVPYGSLLNLDQPSIARPRINVQRSQEAMLISEDNVAGYYQFQPRWVTQAIISSEIKDDYLRRGPNAFDMVTKWPQATVEKIYDLGENRMGRAYPVPDGSVQTAGEALKIMASAEFNPSKHILYQDWTEALKEYPRVLRWVYKLAPSFFIPPTQGELPTPIALNESTRLVAQSPASASFQVGTDEGGFFFFSNSWHPGWVAFVNGVRVPVLRANYAFMAVSLPETPGENRVDFVFRPIPYFMGLATTCLFALAWFGLFALTARRRHLTSVTKTLEYP